MPTVMQWTEHLLGRIGAQQQYAAPYEARYRNEYAVPFVEKEFRDVYGSQVDLLKPRLEAPRAGRAAVVVDALTERTTVMGATSDDAEAARVVQEAWEDNDLDVMHREAHREAFIKSRSFASVHRSDDDRAVVGIESPEQMAVHRMSAPPYDVDASLKVAADEWTGKGTGLLRLPGRDLQLVKVDQPVLDPEDPESGRMSRWVPIEEFKTRLPWVPTVEFSSHPRLLAEPISEIEPITTLVDLGDLIEALLVFAGHFGAVPITFGTGLSALLDPKDPSKPLLGSDGKPQIGFKPRADHFWADSNSDAKFGRLMPASLDTFVQWAQHNNSALRAKTSLASTYFALDLRSHMDAELLKTDEAPMVRRVLGIGRDGSFGQSWRRVDRMILAMERPNSRARVWPRWADPETRVESQATDSAQKQTAMGLGVSVVAEKTLGWDKETVKRAVEEAQEAQERAAEADPLTRATRNLNDLSGQ